MTKDQLARVVEDMLRKGSADPGNLVIGRTSDGAPVLYDPKNNVMIVRDPKALDAGTVYKPREPDLQKYLRDKVPTRVASLPPASLPTVHPPPGRGLLGHRRQPNPGRQNPRVVRRSNFRRLGPRHPFDSPAEVSLADR